MLSYLLLLSCYILLLRLLLQTTMEENIDDLFKLFDDLADNKMDDTKYKESLLAKLIYAKWNF